MVRLVININDETEQSLVRRRQAGVSISETVRRAVALLDWLEREQAAGSRIKIDGPDGPRELVLFD